MSYQGLALRADLRPLFVFGGGAIWKRLLSGLM